MQSARLFCVLSLLLFKTSHSANIVAFMPLPFYSHQTAFKPLWLELAKRGHKITLIQPNVIIENNENITQIVLSGVNDIVNRYKPLDGLGEGQSIIKVMLSALEAISKGIELELTHPGVQELLKRKEKVDLFFTEFLTTFGLFLGRSFNASMISLVSMDANIEGHVAAGNPTHPVVYPDKDMPFPQPLTFKERVSNTLYWLAYNAMSSFVINPLQEKITTKCLGHGPSTKEIAKDISLFFINANPLFNTVRPLGPKTINIGGGVHLMEPQPLPTDLQDYLDNAKNGVIYFSLGSSLTSKHLSNSTKDVILKTFSQLPYNILWKFDKEIANRSDNIKVIKWIPQQDVLRHKNIKLFITQGGLQSMEEAIFSYVPMIALPFYGDQHNNADKMAARGFGFKLDHKKLEVKTFESAILEIINSPKYREKTKQLVNLVLDQPMTGLEKAVWWTEYVLRHGQTDHLKNPSSDIPWYQFLLLDVALFLFFTTLIVTYAFIKALQLLKWFALKLTKKTKTNMN